MPTALNYRVNDQPVTQVEIRTSASISESDDRESQAARYLTCHPFSGDARFVAFLAGDQLWFGQPQLLGVGKTHAGLEFPFSYVKCVPYERRLAVPI